MTPPREHVHVVLLPACLVPLAIILNRFLVKRLFRILLLGLTGRQTDRQGRGAQEGNLLTN